MAFYNTGGSFSLYTGVNTPSIYQNSTSSTARLNGVIISTDPYNAVNSSTIISSISNISSFDDYVSNNQSCRIVDPNFRGIGNEKISGYASASASLPSKAEWILIASNLYRTSYIAGISYTGQYQTIKYSTTSVSFDNYIYYSSNYGNSWNITTFTAPSWVNSTNLVMSLDGSVQLFGDFVSSSGDLYISNNYGVTWSTLVSLGNYFSLVYCPIYSCAISGDGNIITAVSAGSPGLIFQSFNKGVSWVNTVVTFDTGNSFNVMSSDGTYQIIVPDNSNGIFVYDSSISSAWTQNTSPTLPVSLYNAVCMSSNGTIQSVAGNSSIYTSTDKGNTWQLTFNGAVNKLYCDNSGKNQVATSYINGVYLSTDYGMTWNLQQTPSNPSTPYFSYSVLSGDGNHELLSLTNNDTKNFIYKLSLV
jgi:hypothetical protein